MTLVWKREDSVTIRAGDYSVNKLGPRRFDAWLWPDGCGCRWSSVAHKTAEAAKSACEWHHFKSERRY